MNKVIIIFGLQGSGKTTWARKNHPKAHLIEGLSPENTMKMLIACINDDQNLAPRVEGDIVLDSNAFTIHAIAGYVQVAKAFGYEVQMVMLRTPEPEGAKYRQAQQWTLDKLLNNWPTIWGSLYVESVK